MAVTVREIVGLEIFRSAKILTSPRTLNRVVTQCSVTDNPITETDKAISKEGGFYLSSLYFAMDDEAAFLEYIDAIIDFGAAAVCVIDEYIEEIPPHICKYCEAADLAFIQVDSHLPYSDIITSIVQLLLFDQQNALIDSKLGALIDGHLDSFYQNRLIHELNSHFQNSLTVVFCKPESNDITRRNSVIGNINKDLLNIAMSYKGGIIAFLSYGNITVADRNKRINHCTEMIQGAFPYAIIGVSEHSHPLQEAKEAANQAINAVEYSTLETHGVINYSDLGFSRLLIMLNGQTELRDYCHHILDPILDYDRDGEGILLDTLVKFFKHKRNYKDTAAELHVHENTIRHRIERAVQLTNENFSGQYILEELFIACRIYVFLHI